MNFLKYCHNLFTGISALKRWTVGVNKKYFLLLYSTHLFGLEIRTIMKKVSNMKGNFKQKNIFFNFVFHKLTKIHL